jgi:hypothetical protein
MRGWVCPLQLLLALTSADILRHESSGTRDYMLPSQIRDSPNLVSQCHSQIHIATDGQSVCLSRCRAPLLIDSYCLVHLVRPL